MTGLFRQNPFALQLQQLPGTRLHCASGRHFLFRNRLRSFCPLLYLLFYLLFYRFTFPSSRHIYRVAEWRLNHTNQMPYLLY